MPRPAANTKPDQVDAKERLLMAGVKVFGEHGYEGTSTRALANEAGVNISAIAYYYNGKEGLYRAILESIGTMARSVMSGFTDEVEARFKAGDMTDEKATALLHNVMSNFARFLLSERASPYIARILIREQLDPTPNFDFLYEGSMRPMHETLTRLVAFLVKADPADERAILCAHSLLGQAVIFKTHKATALRRLQWQDYGAQEAATIVAMILQQTDAIIAMTREALK
ncbi:CerR family C-terminal domain-containing protein [Gimibacter soli]|uniref:CerR family C-terminal domain-containing protein n=1 Tax=Gimibacter soli TaxID=3024400 RepID=A0AAF0BID7_9PROT|nr:CerR family C-terminal domain-containing protein [Gimibacter soli]WCL55273.1 CerR family C-terminal domain-containing protein [Gimibacter soli]